MTKSRFVLMEHKTLRKKHDHYDLRFKVPGSNDWDSFALPKGLPIGNEKKKIIKTTVHSEKDALYTGEIKAGEYGAGTLKKDDGGLCDILIYDPGRKITIRFNGNKLKGIYHFINLSHIKKGTSKEYWFFKGKLPWKTVKIIY